MPPTYAIHIVAGSAALIGGFIALYSGKGRKAHRSGGMMFVAAMLVMSATGAFIAIARGRAPVINVPTAALSAYLVVTGLTTVRPLGSLQRRLDMISLVMATALGFLCFVLAIAAGAAGGARAGAAYPLIMFGAVSLLAASGDLRIVRYGPLAGRPRLARHLWRMSFALFIAALAFFIGQSQVFPQALRGTGLLALPLLLVLATMSYWLWRVRNRFRTGDLT